MVDWSAYNANFSSIPAISRRNKCDQVCQWLAAGLWFSPGFHHPSRYNWNIVESDIKHHNPL